MAVLNIPEEHASGLTKLQSLPKEKASLLREALTSAAEKKDGAEFSPSDLRPIDGVPEDDIEQIVDAITGLHHARAFFETPIDEFVDDVVESLRSAPKSGFSSGTAAIHAFKERMRDFLEIDQLALAAKSNVLRFEHERILQSLKILTDVRPIFGIDVEKPPEAVAIGHMLKVAYRRGGRLEEEFFALDEDDLRSLKNAVQRAESKANSLRAMLAKQLKIIGQQ